MFVFPYTHLGGKSIALMQTRLLAGANNQSINMNQPQQQQQQLPQRPVPMNPNMQQQQQQNNTMAVGTSPPSSRPKGKDFAAMAARPKGKDFAAMSSRPKGKDFAAMSSRSSTGTPSVQAPAPVMAPMPVNTRQVPQMSPPPPSSSDHLRQQQQPMMPTGRPKGKDFAAMAAKTSVSAPPSVSASMPPKSSSIGMPPMLPTTSSSNMPPASSNVMPPNNNKSPLTSMGYNKAPTPSSYQQKPPQPPRASPYKQQKPIQTPTHPKTTPPTSLESVVNGPLTAPITGPKLSSILSSIDPNYTLDDEVQHQILHLLNDFLEVTTMQSLKLSHHRGSNVLDVKDVQLVLKKIWGMNVPGFGNVDNGADSSGGGEENDNRGDNKRMRTDL